MPEISEDRTNVREALGLFASLSALLASTGTLAEDEHVWVFAEGQRYQVAASAATDHHISRADGTKLYVVPNDEGRLNLLAFGVHPARDDLTDDRDAIQTAINAAAAVGNGVVAVPSGTYYIGSDLELKAYVTLEGTGVYYRGGATKYEIGTELKALPGCTTMLTAVGGDPETYLRSAGIVGIMLDGNSNAQIGINITETVQPHIRMCSFARFVAGASDGDGGTLPGGAAIYGGGILYNIIEQNSFMPGDYYAVYSQENLKSLPQIYYGANHGYIRDNAISARYGVLHEGIQDIYGNAFEISEVLGEAALHINGASSNSYCAIWGNYFEIHPEQLTADPDTFETYCAIKCKAMTGKIFCNRIIGDADVYDTVGSGPAIDLDATNYGVSVDGNDFKYWDVAIKMRQPVFTIGAVSGGLNSTDIGINHFHASVTTRVANSPAATRTFNDTTHASPLWEMQDQEAFYRSGGTFHGSALLGTTSAMAAVNLYWGNHLRFDHDSQGSAVTVSTVNGADPGGLFTISAKVADKTILADSAFGLASGADFTLPADVDLLFVTDPEGNIREVGRTSALHTVVQHDFGSGNENAIEISPGVFVRADVT
jgi:hypothetical protein